MTITNIVSFTLSDEELAEVNAAMDTMSRIMGPKTISLTPELRHELPKMGDKTLAFVEKAIEVANQNPGFVPSFMDMAETNRDLDAFRTLRVIGRKLAVMTQQIEDTGIQAGSEAYTAALGIYGHIKSVVKAVGSVESQKAKDELSARFPGNRAKSVEPEPVSA